MSVDLTKLEELGPLKSGGHTGPEQGACIMEAVSYIAGEPWSDHPECVCPVIARFLRNWNDNLRSNEERDRLLKPLIPVILDTKSTPAIEEQRSYLALDWMVRVFTPTWLRLAKLDDHADRLVALAPIETLEAAQAAGPIVREARDAAGAAARDAAWAAARDAAWDAARDAAWDAAWAAARDAARDAAWDAAGAAAWAAARDAARDAAWDAARDAARDAAGAAAWDAARDALQETVTVLQASAVDLVKRMSALPSQTDGEG